MKFHVDKSMGIVTRMAEAFVYYKWRKRELQAKLMNEALRSEVYLQQDKKKAEAESKNCHAKTALRPAFFSILSI